MAHLKIEMLDQVNLRLTCVYKRGPKENPTSFISIVESTTLIPHDVEHVIHGLGFDEFEEEGIQDMASEFYEYDEMKAALDPQDIFELSELQMRMPFYQYVYKHIDMSEWIELLKQPRNCRVTMLDNKVKVYYV